MEKDDFDKYEELRYALNVIQNNNPEYFNTPGKIVGGFDELKNHFDTRFDNKIKKACYIITTPVKYPELIEECKNCFILHFQYKQECQNGES
jgi:hypothetical protein